MDAYSSRFGIVKPWLKPILTSRHPFDRDILYAGCNTIIFVNHI